MVVVEKDADVPLAVDEHDVEALEGGVHESGFERAQGPVFLLSALELVAHLADGDAPGSQDPEEDQLKTELDLPELDDIRALAQEDDRQTNPFAHEHERAYSAPHQ